MVQIGLYVVWIDLYVILTDLYVAQTDSYVAQVDLDVIHADLNVIQTDLKVMQADLNVIQADLNGIQADLDVTLRIFVRSVVKSAVYMRLLVLALNDAVAFVTQFVPAVAAGVLECTGVELTVDVKTFGIVPRKLVVYVVIVTQLDLSVKMVVKPVMVTVVGYGFDDFEKPDDHY